MILSKPPKSSSQVSTHIQAIVHIQNLSWFDRSNAGNMARFLTVSLCIMSPYWARFTAGIKGTHRRQSMTKFTPEKNLHFVKVLALIRTKTPQIRRFSKTLSKVISTKAEVFENAPIFNHELHKSGALRMHKNEYLRQGWSWTMLEISEVMKKARDREQWRLIVRKASICPYGRETMGWWWWITVNKKTLDVFLSIFVQNRSNVNG